MIRIRCECGAGLSVQASVAAKLSACPRCRTQMRLVSGAAVEAGTFAARLVARAGPLPPGLLVLLGGPAPIEFGKLAGKPLHLPGDLVSRSHGRLVPVGGDRWQLVDDGSRNGTFVNGVRIAAPHPLADGDVVRMGEYEFAYRAAPPAASAAAPTTATQTAATARPAPGATTPTLVAPRRPAAVIRPNDPIAIAPPGPLASADLRRDDGPDDDAPIPFRFDSDPIDTVATAPAGVTTVRTERRDASLAPEPLDLIELADPADPLPVAERSHASDLPPLPTVPAVPTASTPARAPTSPPVTAGPVTAAPGRPRAEVVYDPGDAPDDPYDVTDDPAPPSPPHATARATPVASLRAGPLPLSTVAGAPTMTMTPTAAPSLRDAVHAPLPRPLCPGCRQTLSPGAKICVACGIDLRTGRPIVTAQGLDEDTLYVRAENTIRLISFVIPIGVYPMASEAFGTKRPWVAWGIAVLTILATFMFWAQLSDDPDVARRYMLWPYEPTVRQVEATYEDPESEDVDPTAAAAYAQEKEANGGNSRAAYDALEPHLQHWGRPEPHQWVTHALLHADVMHLAGNLLFLLVFGTRVNALLGQWKTALLYPVLAVIAAGAHVASEAGGEPRPMLGASGAVMGLAGMYFVLFPVHRVHCAAWMRMGLRFGFRLAFRLFAVAGFWVVLFYISFDVLFTLLRLDTGTAHWAHLGGFIAGMALAMVMLVTRLANARGGDLLSVILGPKAWVILGRPGETAAPAAAPTTPAP